MSYILENLYLGDRLNAYNQNFIFNKHINIIVNCTKDIPNVYETNGEITYYRVPVEDNLKENELNSFYFFSKSLLPLLYNEYIKGKSILIHCFAGMQRSAGLMLLFLIYYHKKKFNINLSVNDAKFFILSKRPISFKYGMYVNFEHPIKVLANDIYNNDI